MIERAKGQVLVWAALPEAQRARERAAWDAAATMTEEQVYYQAETLRASARKGR